MKKNYLALLGLFIFGCGTFTIPTTFAHAYSIKHEVPAKMIKNLKNCDYPQQLIVNKEISELSKDAKNDEYRLGMVLLASAQQGDEKRYHQTLLQMQTALSKVHDDNNNSYKTWRLGRILLAADSIGDTVTVNKTLTELKNLLADPQTKQDAFSAWAWGYLAALNETEYKKAKDSMLTAAGSLTATYKKTKQSHSTTQVESMASDALYAWIMALQAAANAQDRNTYDFIVAQMKAMTGQTSLSRVITSNLHRNSESNDYPAWALGMVRLAAATIHDKHVYEELNAPLNEYIQGAKEAGNSSNEKSAYSAKSEATLAQLYATLATTRWSLPKNCSVRST